MASTFRTLATDRPNCCWTHLPPRPAQLVPALGHHARGSLRHLPRRRPVPGLHLRSHTRHHDSRVPAAGVALADADRSGSQRLVELPISYATFPGDDLFPVYTSEATHAITIHASPQQVWPWLMQIGQDRSGLYSYRSPTPPSPETTCSRSTPPKPHTPSRFTRPRSRCGPG